MEQISNRLRLDFPDDPSMRISHEAIYQALFIEGRGALARELVACLRSGRALRVPRARKSMTAWAYVTDAVTLDKRPKAADDKKVLGHLDDDLVIGLQRYVIGTMAERKPGLTSLVHLPREPGQGTVARTKNGPALAGCGAQSMNRALVSKAAELPPGSLRSLTWDRGKELSGPAAFTVQTGVGVYFADPHSPRQRPLNENSGGLLRQYFPKGTDLSRWPTRTSMPSRTHSTLGHANAWYGELPPRYSQKLHSRNKISVLRRPFESAIRPFNAECIGTAVFHRGPTATSPRSSGPQPAGSTGGTSTVSKYLEYLTPAEFESTHDPGPNRELQPA
jgi:hypothetical protein